VASKRLRHTSSPPLGRPPVLQLPSTQLTRLRTLDLRGFQVTLPRQRGMNRQHQCKQCGTPARSHQQDQQQQQQRNTQQWSSNSTSSATGPVAAAAEPQTDLLSGAHQQLQAALTAVQLDSPDHRLPHSDHQQDSIRSSGV
jgi:hypothetical protein